MDPNRKIANFTFKLKTCTNEEEEHPIRELLKDAFGISEDLLEKLWNYRPINKYNSEVPEKAIQRTKSIKLGDVDVPGGAYLGGFIYNKQYKIDKKTGEEVPIRNFVIGVICEYVEEQFPFVEANLNNREIMTITDKGGKDKEKLEFVFQNLSLNFSTNKGEDEVVGKETKVQKTIKTAAKKV